MEYNHNQQQIFFVDYQRLTMGYSSGYTVVSRLNTIRPVKTLIVPDRRFFEHKRVDVYCMGSYQICQPKNGINHKSPRFLGAEYGTVSTDMDLS